MSGNLIATFEEAAPRYDSSGARFAGPVADELVARAGLRPGDDVLDVGCGAGAVTIRCAEAVAPGGRVTSLDLSDAMLRRTAAEAAARGFGHVLTRRGDASRPPFAAVATCVRQGGRVREAATWSAAGVAGRADGPTGRAGVHRHRGRRPDDRRALHRAAAVVAGLLGRSAPAGLAAHTRRGPGRRSPGGLRAAGPDARAGRHAGPARADGLRNRHPPGCYVLAQHGAGR